MKKILVLIVILYGCIQLPAQDYKHITDQIKLKQICDTRGHVPGEVHLSATKDTMLRVFDYEDYSVILKPANYKKAYKCIRCGQIIKEPVYLTVDTIYPHNKLKLDKYKYYKIKFIRSSDNYTKVSYGEIVKDYPVIKLSDLLDYQEYCYNDSTEVCGFKFVQSGTWGSLATGYDEYQCWWEHKKPTFSDFIEWLHKKYDK